MVNAKPTVVYRETIASNLKLQWKFVQNVAENSDTQLYLNSDIVVSWIVGRVSEMVNIFIHISLFFIDVFLKQKSVGNSRLLTIHF